MTTTFTVKMQTCGSVAILLAIIFTGANAYSKFGRKCADIGCLSHQVCEMKEQPCTSSSSECGLYPSCVNRGGAETCQSKLCPSGQYCKTEGGVPTCVDTKSGLDELIGGILDGPTPTSSQKAGQQLQSGQSDPSPANPANNKPSAPAYPSAPGYPPGSAYPPAPGVPPNGYPGYPQGGYPNPNGAPNPYNPYAPPPNGYPNMYPSLPPNGYPNPGQYNPNYPLPPNGIPPNQGGYNPYYGGPPPPSTTKKPGLSDQLTQFAKNFAKQVLTQAILDNVKTKLQ